MNTDNEETRPISGSESDTAKKCFYRRDGESIQLLAISSKLRGSEEALPSDDQVELVVYSPRQRVSWPTPLQQMKLFEIATDCVWLDRRSKIGRADQIRSKSATKSTMSKDYFEEELQQNNAHKLIQPRADPCHQ